jgi:hypothetical protein
MYMTTTTDGARVNDGKNLGLTEDQAKSDAQSRNARAEKLGIKTRYETAPFAKNG